MSASYQSGRSGQGLAVMRFLLCIVLSLTIASGDVESFAPLTQTYGLTSPIVSDTCWFLPTTSRRNGVVVWAKKKKKGGGGGSKIQVKLLKHVPGTGQAGDVVMVTSAFFENKLRPTKSATMITDKEVQEEQDVQQAKDDAKRKAAMDLQETINDMVLEIPRKAGPDGQLFGGVGVKGIMDELSKVVGNSSALKDKGVKMISLKDDDNKELGGHGIKNLGEYSAILSLLKDDVTCKFKVKVIAQS